MFAFLFPPSPASSFSVSLPFYFNQVYWEEKKEKILKLSSITFLLINSHESLEIFALKRL